MKLPKLLMFILVILGSLSINAQTLEINEIDEFTGIKRKVTSWETVAIVSKFGGYMRFADNGGAKLLSLKAVIGAPGKMFYVERDTDFLIKLEDGTVITLKNEESVVACMGCGARGYGYSQAFGIHLNYILSTENFQKLLNSKIVKIRLITSIGTVDQELKPKASDTLLAAIKLLVG